MGKLANRTLEERIAERVLRAGDCLVWQGAKTSSGYGQIRVAGKNLQVHRLVYELKVGKPGDLLVLHSCDNRPCCEESHLFLGTNVDNMADMRAKGRSRHGELAHTAKLTRDVVIAIRERYSAGGIFQHQLAAEYGVDQSTISDAIRASTWRY